MREYNQLKRLFKKAGVADGGLASSVQAFRNWPENSRGAAEQAGGQVAGEAYQMVRFSQFSGPRRRPEQTMMASWGVPLRE